LFNISKRIQKTLKYRKVYKNYLSVLLQLFFKNEASLQNDKIMIKAVLKDGTKLNVPYGWVVRFAEFNMYQNANVSNLTLTRKWNLLSI